MGTVTKVMLVLIILAGGAGIFFGLSMAPSKIEALHKKVADAGSEAKTKDDTIRKTGDELGVAKTNFENKSQEVTNLNAKVLTAEKTAADKTTEAAQNAKAVQDFALKTQEFDALDLKYKADQVKLNGLAKLESDLVAYKGLTFVGQAVPDANKLQDYLKELEAFKTKPVAVTKALPPAAKTAGKVTNVDPKFGFIQIDFSAADAPKDTIFKVKRGGNFVGQIKVVRSVGPSTYCQVDKANTPGQITAGDTVEKAN